MEKDIITKNVEKDEKDDQKTIISTILNIVGTIITVILATLAILTLVGMYNQSKTGEPFTILGYKPVVIQTGSMEPTILTNAVVLVQKTKDVEENDMILFETEGGYVVHRYYRTNEDGSIVTKGDANKYEDMDPINFDQVFGKVVFTANWAAPVVYLITGNTGVG